MNWEGKPLNSIIEIGHTKTVEVNCKVCGKDLERVHNTKQAICVKCKKEYNKKKRDSKVLSKP